MHAWRECWGTPGDLPADAPRAGGLDLSATTDLTAFVRVMRTAAGGYRSHGHYFAPASRVVAMRRRGVTPEALRAFWESAGVTKTNSRAEMAQLEYAIRDDLNTRAPRVLAVLDPLKVTVTNWPENEVDYLHGDYWPRDIAREGSRPVPFGRTLLIERDDFAENPPKDYYRLAPGRAVRLRHAYVLRCDEVVKDDAGEVGLRICTYFPRDEQGHDTSGLNPKGTIHWVSADHAIEAEVRL